MKLIEEIFRSYAQLDANGRHVGGTDRQSNHAYGEAYEQLIFSRSATQLVMEVGVADGSGMKAWRDIFPRALIVGLDKEPCAARNAGLDRMEFHVGNQRSKEDCERAAAGRQFDFIVDDACHEIDAQLLTFSYLWPFVRPGGVYVIEEPAHTQQILDAIPGSVAVPTTGPFGGIEPLIVVRKAWQQ